MSAALWAAIAATFSAISSGLMVWIQRQNFLESIRPEIILTGWTRRKRGEGDSAHEVLSIEKIKNIGKGTALHVYLNSPLGEGNRPVAILSTINLPILPKDEENSINGGVIIWWKNVEGEEGAKSLGLMVEISCFDTRGLRHTTNYNLRVFENVNQIVGGAQLVAPGVALATRRTIIENLKLKKCLVRLRERSAKVWAAAKS